MQTEFSANYTNHWHVMMRRELKQRIFDAIRQTDSPFPENSGLALWIYGSTGLFVHQLAGYELAFPKKKSHDLDLAVFNPKQLDPRVYEQDLSDYFGKIFNQIGLKRISRAHDDKTANQPENVGNIFLSYTPTQADIDAVMKQDRLMPDLKIPDNFQVVLDFDLALKEPPALLYPKQSTYFSDSKTPTVVDDIRNTIAKKLPRVALPRDFSYGHDPQHFKPRDVIDVFNSFYATPWLINYDRNRQNNDIELMRTMFIVNCLSMGVPLDKISLEHFEATPEKIRQLQQGLESGISTALDLNNRVIRDMLTCVQKVFSALCPELKNGAGVQLSPKEQNFVEQLQGYTYANGQHQLIDPTINPRLLLSDQICASFPELPSRLSSMSSLKDLMESIRSRRSQISDY